VLEGEIITALGTAATCMHAQHLYRLYTTFSSEREDKKTLLLFFKDLLLFF